jgi:hypothetical protein
MASGVFVHFRAFLERAIAGEMAGPDPAVVRGATTPNMRQAHLVCAWAWAAINLRVGSVEERRRRAALIAFFDLQKRLGLQCLTDRPREERDGNEQLTPSHHEVWSTWVYLVILLCRRARKHEAIELRELLGRADWWVGAQLAIWELVDRHRTGVLAIAGARAGQDREDRGKDGVDTEGPRRPQNDGRDREWRLILLQRGEWKNRRKPERIGVLPIALDEGYHPVANVELPQLAEPMVIRWHADGAATTSCAGSSPGRGGAQFVQMNAQGSTDPFRVLDVERLEAAIAEWRTNLKLPS